ncbi:MAG: hypothetical protein K0U69_06850 [Actinomycetia bacterium]|nr:hypothetical protein [Actinomycetes bacterium]
MSAAPKTDTAVALRVAAAASLGVAIIHLAVLPGHWEQWALSGIFFALIAAFQFGWAIVVVAYPNSAVLATGIAVNAGPIALWALSRTAGMPFGEHLGEPETAQAADVAAVLLETTLIISAGWAWTRRDRAGSVSSTASRSVLATAGAAVATAVTIGVISGLDHGHHGPSGSNGHLDHQHRSPPDLPPDPSPIDSPPTIPRPPAQEPPHHHDHD